MFHDKGLKPAFHFPALMPDSTLKGMLKKFLDERLLRSDNKKDITYLKDVWLAYKAHSNTRGGTVEDYKNFESEMQIRFGEMTRKSGAQRDFWRRIKLLPDKDDAPS